MLQKQLTKRVGVLAAAAVVASLAVPLSTVPAESSPAASTPSNPSRRPRHLARHSRRQGDLASRLALAAASFLAADRPNIVEGGRELGLTIIGSDGRRRSR